LPKPSQHLRYATFTLIAGVALRPTIWMACWEGLVKAESQRLTRSLSFAQASPSEWRRKISAGYSTFSFSTKVQKQGTLIFDAIINKTQKKKRER